MWHIVETARWRSLAKMVWLCVSDPGTWLSLSATPTCSGRSLRWWKVLPLREIYLNWIYQHLDVVTELICKCFQVKITNDYHVHVYILKFWSEVLKYREGGGWRGRRSRRGGEASAHASTWLAEYLPGLWLAGCKVTRTLHRDLPCCTRCP